MCVRWGESEENIEHISSRCSAVSPLCGVIEDFMLRGKFFAFETSCVYSNVVPPLSKAEHGVLFFTGYYASRDGDDAMEVIP